MVKGVGTVRNTTIFKVVAVLQQGEWAIGNPSAKIEISTQYPRVFRAILGHLTTQIFKNDGTVLPKLAKADTTQL